MDKAIESRINGLLKISRIRSLYSKIEEVYSTSQVFAHGWDHIHRVLVNALLITDKMGCSPNMEIVIPSVLLHDIGFLYDPDPYIHHITGAEHCHEYLDEWNAEENAQIEGCIRNHKGLMACFNTRPVSLEEQIVCDADLLEKSGFIGLMQGVRTFVEFGERSHAEYKSLYEIAKHLMQLRDIEFFTTAGRKIAFERGGLALRADVFAAAAKEMELYYNYTYTGVQK